LSEFHYRVPAAYLPGAGWEPERLLSADNPERRGFAGCPFCRVPDRMAIPSLCRWTIIACGWQTIRVKIRRFFHYLREQGQNFCAVRVCRNGIWFEIIFPGMR
jgi:hypothetical protein